MEKKEFREEFSQFMKQTGKSQKQVSKETGLSTSVISQFLDGKYTGDNGKVQDILNKFLSISKDRLNSVSGTTYYPDLYNTKEVLYACWYAHKYNDIALVAGIYCYHGHACVAVPVVFQRGGFPGSGIPCNRRKAQRGNAGTYLSAFRKQPSDHH